MKFIDYLLTYTALKYKNHHIHTQTSGASLFLTIVQQCALLNFDCDKLTRTECCNVCVLTIHKHHLNFIGPGSASVASNTTVNYSDERDKVYIVYYSTFVCHRFCADEHKFSCVSRTISFNQSYMYCTCMHTQNTFRNTCSTYCTCTCCCEVTQCHL